MREKGLSKNYNFICKYYNCLRLFLIKKTIISFLGILVFLFGVISIIISCDVNNRNEVPRDFEIVQVGEFTDKLLLRWTESTDPENSIVTYDIFIKEDIEGTTYLLEKGGLIDSSFGSNGNYGGFSINKPSTRFIFSYPILNLEDGKNWKVKITATDQEGNRKEIVIKATTKVIVQIEPLEINYTIIKQPFPEFSRVGHTVIEFKNKLWMIGGRNGFNIYNDVWSSEDGITWVQITEQAPFGVRYAHGSFVHNNKLWVIGGLDFSNTSGGVLKDIWSSEDGISWENVSEKLPNYAGEHVVAFNDKIWLIAAKGFEYYEGILYESSDGISWAKNTSFGVNGYSYPEDLKVYDNKIWIANNIDANKTLTVLNPLINERKTYKLPQGYFNRSSQQINLIQDRLVVLFGYQNQTPLKDVWSSVDGIWVQEKSFDYGIYNHKSVSFNKKLFIFGGVTSSIYNRVFNENIIIIE
ncbi:hypothetical protein EYD45_14670 [Hyunsoonleella flava]|uniref:Cadherin domain-containing protein n=1 Tax=Hyunsoonleella flava TaxID=2527939 RepID=A0A4Q9FA05_9FLAO|nr:hypothetical protein [Hyunsoonleella flava]TBN00179.1 hypothetical protein EYD45_14670 [Hyunsoonleella flava]